MARCDAILYNGHGEAQVAPPATPGRTCLLIAPDVDMKTRIAAALAALAFVAAPPLTAPSLLPTLCAQAPQAGPGWLGVVLADSDAGVAVRRVMPESPAEEAGLSVGTVVVSIDEVPVATSGEFVAYVGSRTAGTEIELRFARADMAPMRITLGPRPDDAAAVASRLQGRQAPTAMVRSLDGAAIDLGQVNGRVRLVEFWATWCGPCTAARPRIAALRERYTEGQLDIVAVTDEAEGVVRRYLERNPMAWTIALDESLDANQGWWVLSYPTFFVVDGTGVIRGVYFGVDGIRAAEREVTRLLGGR